MNSMLTIFFSAYLIGFSGAMMPGPMLGVTIDKSLRRGFIAGPLIVLGHGILELGLILLMILGLSEFFANPTVSAFIGLFGGLFLAWMGFDMVKSSIKKTVSIENQGRKSSKLIKNLVLLGLIVSVTNPYFILWWATTGMESIRQAYVLGVGGVSCFFIGHILSDLTWYSVVSLAFAKGKKVMSDRIYRRVILGLGVFLLGFAYYFVSSGLEMLKASNL